MFQHTAARRRLPQHENLNKLIKSVSTHSRPKAAAYGSRLWAYAVNCFNTQPPEGGCLRFSALGIRRQLFQHTAARRRLRLRTVRYEVGTWFQHTAARRRLLNSMVSLYRLKRFQHTAARRRLHKSGCALLQRQGFNTQPPEGGCHSFSPKYRNLGCFNTQPPEGGCSGKRPYTAPDVVSTHSRPKAAASSAIS